MFNTTRKPFLAERKPILWQKQRSALINLHIFRCLVVLKWVHFCILPPVKQPHLYARGMNMQWRILVTDSRIPPLRYAICWQGRGRAPSDSVWIKFTCLLSIHFTAQSFPLKNKIKTNSEAFTRAHRRTLRGGLSKAFKLIETLQLYC